MSELVGPSWNGPTRIVCRVAGFDLPGMAARMGSRGDAGSGEGERLGRNGFECPGRRAAGVAQLETDGAGGEPSWGIRSLVTGCVYAWGSTQQDAELMCAASGSPDRYEVVRRCGVDWVPAGLVSLPSLPRFALSPQDLPVLAFEVDREGHCDGRGAAAVPKTAERPPARKPPIRTRELGRV